MGLSQEQVARFFAERPFTYQATLTWPANADVGATGQTSFQVKDTDFVCTSLIIISRHGTTGVAVTAGDVDVSADTSAASDYDPAVLVSIKDGGSDQDWFSTAIDGALFARPALLPRPRLLRRAGTQTISLTLQRDTGAATSVVTRVMFHGYDLNY